MPESVPVAGTMFYAWKVLGSVSLLLINYKNITRFFCKIERTCRTSRPPSSSICFSRLLVHVFWPCLVSLERRFTCSSVQQKNVMNFLYSAGIIFVLLPPSRFKSTCSSEQQKNVMNFLYFA